MEKIVQFIDVSKSFGSLKAVNHMNLDIQKGEIFGLLGPNGAGKSTAINMLCGLTEIDYGKILIDEKEMKKHSYVIKNKMGYVPQEIAIYPTLSAFENVAYFGGLYGLKGKELKQKTQEALDFVGLGDTGKTMAKNFSGGMKRRLNIACAIVHQPELIIMDEPTVGIDPQSRNHVLNSIRKLSENGSTIIYVTHYMEEVEAICNRVAIIDQGKVIAQGTIDEMQALISDYTYIHIKVADAHQVSKEHLLAIDGVEIAEIDHGLIKLSCHKNLFTLTPIIDQLREFDLDILSFETQRPSLELVFLTLTGKKLRD